MVCHVLDFSPHRGALYLLQRSLSNSGGQTTTPARTRGSKTNVHMGRPDMHGIYPPSTPAVRQLS